MKLTGFQSDSLTLPEANEAWRFTAMAKSLPEVLRPATGKGDADVIFTGNSVVLNELPGGIEVEQNTETTSSDFWHLLPAAGPTLTLSILKTPHRPLRVLVSREAKSAEEATLGQLFIKVAASQKVMIQQVMHGNELGLSAHSTKLALSADSLVEHGVIIENGPEAMQMGHFSSVLSERSMLSQTFVVTGGKMTRVQVDATLNGVAAHASLASITKLNGQSHVDLNSTLRHLSPETTASQLAKNLLDGEAKAIFTGKVHIAKDCQQVTAEQLNRNLLLSKKAHAIGQPQLEILADDVKCSHGSTTGQIEEDATFYLLSRGITKERAAALLTRAFTEEVIHQAPLPLQNFLRGGL